MPEIRNRRISHSMATIIISDLHNRVDWVESALSSPLLKPYDNVIFLGDYFDDFNDTPEDVTNSAKWLKQSLSRPNRIHLCGTHDIWYRFPDNQYIQASGNTEEKSDAINRIITEKDWELLKLFHYEQDFLFTHAGVHSYLLNKYALENRISMQGEIINKIIKPATEKALMDVCSNKPNEWLDAGFARGGMQVVGGITWLGATRSYIINCLVLPPPIGVILLRYAPAVTLGCKALRTI